MLTCLFVIFALLLVKFTIFLLPYVVIVSCNGLCDSWGKKSFRDQTNKRLRSRLYLT